MIPAGLALEMAMKVQLVVLLVLVLVLLMLLMLLVLLVLLVLVLERFTHCVAQPPPATKSCMHIFSLHADGGFGTYPFGTFPLSVIAFRGENV
jgi:hypothetical protein